ncbi:MAG: hypothetical protein HEQ38_08450 [Gemmatimonas sp.]|nr:hypothetical protein [Gemmatimonas sp.]
MARRLTYSAAARRTAAPQDGDFRSMLGVSLRSATRLAAFAGLVMLAGASSLSAQAAPPASPPGRSARRTAHTAHTACDDGGARRHTDDAGQRRADAGCD